MIEENGCKENGEEETCGLFAQRTHQPAIGLSVRLAR